MAMVIDRVPAPGDPAVRRQLGLLSQMVEEISGELALEPLLARLVQRACKLIGADDGVIGLYVPELDVIRTAASHAIPNGQFLDELPRGHGLTGRVLELGAPVRCRYADLPHPSRVEARDMNVIGMPIRRHDELIGVFGIAAWPPKELGDAEQELLEYFARHAAIAIANARRYAEEQRRALRFAMIARIGGIITSDTELDPLLQHAADAIHELLGFSSVDVALVDPADPQTLVIAIRSGEYDKCIRHVDRLPISSGIIGAAASSRRTQLVNNVAADPRYVTPPGVTPARAELAIPMLYGSELLGVINVEGDGPYDELDSMSLGVVAEHLAVAVHNARLIVQSRRLLVLEERQRLARELHDNVTQILASISLMAQSLSLGRGNEPVDTAGRAERLAELAQMAFQEMRELLRELMPGELPPGGSSASAGEGAPLHALAGVLLERHGLPTAMTHLLSSMVPDTLALNLDFEGYVPQELPRERTLLRVCQEAVSNVIRHAGARRVDVTLRVDRERVKVTVADNGCGVPADAPRGFGLANMEKRLIEMGGSLRLARRRWHGTLLRAVIPRLDRGPD